MTLPRTSSDRAQSYADRRPSYRRSLLPGTSCRLAGGARTVGVVKTHDVAFAYHTSAAARLRLTHHPGACCKRPVCSISLLLWPVLSSCLEPESCLAFLHRGDNTNEQERSAVENLPAHHWIDLQLLRVGQEKRDQGGLAQSRPLKSNSPMERGRL